MNTNILTMIEQAEVAWKPLGEVAELQKGKTITAKQATLGNIPVISGGQKPAYFTGDYNRNGETITVAGSGAYAGFVMYWNEPIFVGDAFSVKPNSSLLITKYVYHFLLQNQNKIYGMKKGSGVPHVYPKDLATLEIPIPPLELQKEIVKRLDILTELEATLEAELILRKKQYQYYQDFLLSESELAKVGFEWKTLGSITSYEQPTKYLVKSKDYNDDFQIPVLTAGKTFILGYTNETNGIYQASKNPVIIFDDFTTANKWVDFDFKAKSSAMKMITSIDEKQVLLKYIYYWLNTLPSGLIDGDHKRQWISNFANKKIPIPPLDTQAKIVAILDKFDCLTNSITDGLPKEIELRRKQYEYYRELLLGFENDAKI